MFFDCSYTQQRVVLEVRGQDAGFLGRIWSRNPSVNLDGLIKEHRHLAFALADLRAVAEESNEQLVISESALELTHRLASSVDAGVANVLGLPPLVDLSLQTDAEGSLGTNSFRLRYEWRKSGVRQNPPRTGCILETASGLRRLPLWMFEAIEVADQLAQTSSHSQLNETAHWEALAKFRRALEPIADETIETAASMTEFLRGLSVRLVDRLSISPNSERTDFEVIPFSGYELQNLGLNPEDGNVSESSSALVAESLACFQQLIRQRGALAAYRMGAGDYVVVDRSARPALEVMVRMQRAEESERSDFIQNPRALISEAYRQNMQESGVLNGLTPEGEQEALDSVGETIFVETVEFSERVTGLEIFRAETGVKYDGGKTTWLPEQFEGQVTRFLETLDADGLTQLARRLCAAIENGQTSIQVEELEIPANREFLELVQAFTVRRSQAASPPSSESPPEHHMPIVLATKVNFQNVNWAEVMRPRQTTVEAVLPALVRTQLKDHQLECLDWQIEAWKKGLPGILNADEQGLGKTLETIAFLAWLQQHNATDQSQHRGPILVVAPTSLLENWEKEVCTHLKSPGLGKIIRLYGSGIGQQRSSGSRGMDTEDGVQRLDFSSLHEEIRNKNAHQIWILTTYTTLTNYHHSLARIPFSAIVFDEVQAIKNPINLRAAAARSLKADFRIGLTGTPIENSTIDLWAIMHVLASGALGSLEDFRARYGEPDDDNMRELHERMFIGHDGMPPLSLRRLKEVVATDLPPKTRRLHPRIMPTGQAVKYGNARLILASKRPGAALKALHQIRSVSVHPSLGESMSDEDFVAASARLMSVIDILEMIAKKGERVLVFIEHRQMQYRFIELARSHFDLKNIDLINGTTPINQRQKIVDRFQRYQSDERTFDLLVLGPKAAGTGLTLTAATHVIHLSRWWNPAVEEQCNDRVHRLGQTRPVHIHVPVAVHPDYREHSFDCLLHSLMQRKRRLARAALWPMGDTGDDSHGLHQSLVGSSAYAPGGIDQTDLLTSAISAMFLRDGVTKIPRESDGSYVV